MSLHTWAVSGPVLYVWVNLSTCSNVFVIPKSTLEVLFTLADKCKVVKTCHLTLRSQLRWNKVTFCFLVQLLL